MQENQKKKKESKKKKGEFKKSKIVAKAAGTMLFQEMANCRGMHN